VNPGTSSGSGQYLVISEFTSTTVLTSFNKSVANLILNMPNWFLVVPI